MSRLEELTELVRSHLDAGKNVVHGASWHILPMDWHRNRASIGMPHEVMAALNAGNDEPDALQRLDNLGSRDYGDVAGHKPARYYKSGHVECQSEFIRYADLFD